MKKHVPYDDYWNSKGEYGQKRVIRKNIRREKRKKRRSGSCPTCKRNPKSSYSHSCPYSEDIHGDYISECSCCGSCQHQCAMDI